MTIGEAIQKAFKNGWRHNRIGEMKSMGQQGAKALLLSLGYEFLLDPLFWQALGKAMGWSKLVVVPYDVTSMAEKEWQIKFHTIPEWQYRWHRMIDHLANGGTIKSFFETL